MSIHTAIASRFGIDIEHDDELSARFVPRPELLHHGMLRPTVVVLMVDMLAGMSAEANVGGDWVFTTDLSARMPRTDVPELVTGSVAPLRIGRGSLTNEMFLSADGSEYAYGQAEFIRLPRRHGDPEKPHLNITEPRVFEPLDVPLVTAAGVEVTDAADGRVSVELIDELRNPAGAMQGAMVSLTAEIAAEALAETHLGVPVRITDIDLRYLAMARVGPMVAHARWIGEPTFGAIRVELRDQGADNRLTTAVLVRVAPISPPR